MERADVSRSILGGFVATVVMTVMMYRAPMMGMPKMDVAAMLGAMLGGSWWLGMIMHFLDGAIIFPLVFALLLYRVLPGKPWLRGLLWGLALWFLAQAMVMPLMGMGFFSTNAPRPMKAVLGSLLGHMIYGAILGAIVGTPAVVGSLSATDGRYPSGLPKAR